MLAHHRNPSRVPHPGSLSIAVQNVGRSITSQCPFTGVKEKLAGAGYPNRAVKGRTRLFPLVRTDPRNGLTSPAKDDKMRLPFLRLPSVIVRHVMTLRLIELPINRTKIMKCRVVWRSYVESRFLLKRDTTIVVPAVLNSDRGHARK